MSEPTPDDMGRDLAADLAEFKRLARAVPEWVGGTMREPDLALFARQVTGAAIRRALTAEAEADRLRKEVATLRTDREALATQVDALERAIVEIELAEEESRPGPCGMLHHAQDCECEGAGGDR